MTHAALIGALTIGLVCHVSGEEQTGRVRVEVHTGVDPIVAAEVVVLGVTQLTDDRGVAVIDGPASTVTRGSSQSRCLWTFLSGRSESFALSLCGNCSSTKR